MSSSESMQICDNYRFTDKLSETSWMEDYPKAILTFCYGSRGPKASYNNRPVYPHRDYPQIEVGESWFCALESHSECYFAIPIQEIDMPVMFRISSEFRVEAVRIMLEQYPELARSILRETVKDEGSWTGSPEDVNDVTDSEHECVLEEVQKCSMNSNESSESREPGSVYKSGPNRLASTLFIEQRYNVSISRDRSVMRIQASPTGQVVCNSYTMEIEGLDIMMPNLEQSSLKYRVSKMGAIWITVKEVNSAVDDLEDYNPD